MADLHSLRATVVMVDGTVYDVTAINPDLIRYEDYGSPRGWNLADKAPMKWTTFVCWAALKRTQQITEDWDAWQLQVGNVEPIKDADNTVVEVDPTQQAADSS